jgi:hypothetical protein
MYASFNASLKQRFAGSRKALPPGDAGADRNGSAEPPDAATTP